MTDLSNNPQFTELPQKFQEVLKDRPVTAMMGEDEWHEVVFKMTSGICVQCAVVNRKYVPLPAAEVEQLAFIERIL